MDLLDFVNHIFHYIRAFVIVNILFLNLSKFFIFVKKLVFEIR